MNAHVAAGLAYEREQIALPNGRFVAEVGSLRLDWSFSTRMFLNALVQYDNGQDAWLSNVRFNFVHRPLSDLYLVWNEGRALDHSSRALILKYSQSFSF